MYAFEKTLFNALRDVMDQVWRNLPPSANAPELGPASRDAATEQKAA